MAICPKCEFEFEEKAIVAPDIKIYTLEQVFACNKCGKPFGAYAYWDEKLGYICERCSPDGAR